MPASTCWQWRRHDRGGASGRRLREGRGEAVRFVAGRVQRRLECFDRHERVGESVANGLERRDRSTELDPFHRVRTRQGKHRPAGTGDLVRDRAPAGRDRGVPRAEVEPRVDGHAVLHAHDVEARVRIDALHRAHVDGRARER